MSGRENQIPEKIIKARKYFLAVTLLIGIGHPVFILLNLDQVHVFFDDIEDWILITLIVLCSVFNINALILKINNNSVVYSKDCIFIPGFFISFSIPYNYISGFKINNNILTLNTIFPFIFVNVDGEFVGERNLKTISRKISEKVTPRN
tara:strand:- start:71 stop:517 length:447 start_codon:yes stop_codon:yes gene_type:complete